MSATPPLLPGVYRHYKGKTYFVLGLSQHSESGEICVVYRPLYDSSWTQLWHRPYDMFTGTVELDGRSVPRFERIED